MTKRNPVPFRWAALTLSALVAPAPIALAVALDTLHPVYAFVICTVIGYVLTLGIIAVLLLPALWILSWAAPIKGWLTALLGGLIAFLLFLGSDYISWGASGVDSGPPDSTYAEWVAKNWFSWEPLGLVGLGVVSAAAYHYLATRKSRPVTPDA
jgi:hypothetical protein